MVTASYERVAISATLIYSNLLKYPGCKDFHFLVLCVVWRWLRNEHLYKQYIDIFHLNLHLQISFLIIFVLFFYKIHTYAQNPHTRFISGYFLFIIYKIVQCTYTRTKCSFTQLIQIWCVLVVLLGFSWVARKTGVGG